MKANPSIEETVLERLRLCAPLMSNVDRVLTLASAKQCVLIDAGSLIGRFGAADARHAETTGVLDVLTIDRRDFGSYRTARGKALRNVLDSTPKSKSTKSPTSTRPPKPKTPWPARPTR